MTHHDLCVHEWGIKVDPATGDDLKLCIKCGEHAPAPASFTVSLPPEVAQYEQDLRRFVDAMVYKLQVHAKKGRWENLPIGKALELMQGEVGELTEAVERGNLVEILLESADVANFALITASIAVERGK